MTTDQAPGAIFPKRVFVISPIGGPGTPERTRADRFLKYIVRAALPEPNYFVERADEHDSPLAISAAMLSSIVDSDICVADITGRNPNVFYELALAHAMDKHVVIMDGDKERSPFDIQDQRAIKYGLMPDEVEAAVAQLRSKATIAETHSAFRDMMNPVATAFRAWTNQQKVESSGDSAEQALLRMFERLEDKVDRLATLPRSASGGPRETPRLPEHWPLDKARRLVAAIEHGVNTGRLPYPPSFFETGQRALQGAEAGEGLENFAAWAYEAEERLQEARIKERQAGKV